VDMGGYPKARKHKNRLGARSKRRVLR